MNEAAESTGKLQADGKPPAKSKTSLSSSLSLHLLPRIEDSHREEPAKESTEAQLASWEEITCLTVNLSQRSKKLSSY